MKLVGLARGGEGRASLSGGEMRNARDWDLLKDEHAVAADGKGYTRCTSYTCHAL